MTHFYGGKENAPFQFVTTKGQYYFVMKTVNENPFYNIARQKDHSVKNVYLQKSVSK